MGKQFNPNNKITLEELNKVLGWDEEQGRFRWKINPNLNQIAEKGGFAGCEPIGKPRIIGINNQNYQEAYLVWFMNTGEWPKNGICFKDKDNRNTRFENLLDLGVKATREYYKRKKEISSERSKLTATSLGVIKI